MPELCKFPLCKSWAHKDGLCINHARHYSESEVKAVNKPVIKKPIAKKSEKMKSQEKEYRKIVREMLAEDDSCELRTPECTGQAQGLHHKKKRGSNYLNKKYLARACNACNGWCESHPLEAVEMGLLISNHKIS